MVEQTIHDALGGEDGIRAVVSAFYASIFDDPVLQPVFGSPVAKHVDHLTAFLAEAFGGPDRYTRELGGFDAIVAVHRGKRITPEQRARFRELFLRAYDTCRPDDDPRLRDAVASCIDYGTEIAMVNSNARSDDELHPQREMPRWHW
jgi:hemoglobin